MRWPSPGSWLGPEPGWGRGEEDAPQRQAWRQAGAQMGGLGGRVPGFGPSDPNACTGPPPQDPHPRWPPLWGERGCWEPGLGAPGVSSLVFLERLNGKCLADGTSLTGPQGPPCQNPHPGTWGDYTRPSLLSFRAPSRDAPPWLCPTSGGDQSANHGSLWAGRHQGGGVAPGCKALAEEVWGARRPFQTPPQVPAWQGTWGLPSSAPWATGVGSHLSSFVGGIAMRGQ